MSAKESWKILFCFGLCIIFNLFAEIWRKENIFEFLEVIFFMLFFLSDFSKFLFLTLFCSLVAHIIFNQRSFCRIYPQKGGVFIFSNYVVVAPIFAADYLQNYIYSTVCKISLINMIELPFLYRKALWHINNSTIFVLLLKKVLQKHPSNGEKDHRESNK